MPACRRSALPRFSASGGGTPVACATGVASGPAAETQNPGQSGLSFEEGQYHYNWKTEKSWAGTCRQLVVKLADNTTHTALFSFKG